MGKLYLFLLQNAPFRSHIFKIVFASGGKEALTPITKIMPTLLVKATALKQAVKILSGNHTHS